MRFALLLARTLGMTLEEMGQRMSAAEFALHWADFRRQPWHEERADVRAAMLAATMVNINPYRKKGAKPAKVEDFMLYREGSRPGKPTTFEDLQELFAGD